MKKFEFSITIKAETLNEAIRDFRKEVKEAVEEDEIIEMFDVKEVESGKKDGE